MRQLPPPRVPPRERPHIHSAPLCATQGAFTTLTAMHFATAALGLPAEAYLAAAASFDAASFSVATHVSRHVTAAIACAIATTILAAPVTTTAINTVSITAATHAAAGRSIIAASTTVSIAAARIRIIRIPSTLQPHRPLPPPYCPPNGLPAHRRRCDTLAQRQLAHTLHTRLPRFLRRPPRGY